MAVTHDFAAARRETFAAFPGYFDMLQRLGMPQLNLALNQASLQGSKIGQDVSSGLGSLGGGSTGGGAITRSVAMLAALHLRPLPEKNVILTDARDLDPLERQSVENAAISHLPNVKDLLHYPLPNRPLYIHLDTDIVDPHAAPAMNYPAAGGPSVEELRLVMRRLHQAGTLAAVSMSSWNPKLDHDGQSRTICMQLLAALLNG